MKNERIECEIKVPVGYYSEFYGKIRRNYNGSYGIHIFFDQDVGVVFDNIVYLEFINWQMQTVQVLYNRSLG